MLFRILLLLSLGIACLAENQTKPPTTVKIAHFFRPNQMENATTRELVKFNRKHPDIFLEEWNGISLPGGKSSLMMAIAGGTAPDIGLSWFHILRNEIKQEFLYPLNEWIGEDLNKNGKLDDSEIKWEPWKKVPPLFRKVATVNGKIYGLPLPEKNMVAIIYRTDLVAAAGLDPNKPPKTWDELRFWCYKLTDTEKVIPGSITRQGQKAILISSEGWKDRKSVV